MPDPVLAAAAHALAALSADPVGSLPRPRRIALRRALIDAGRGDTITRGEIRAASLAIRSIGMDANVRAALYGVLILSTRRLAPDAPDEDVLTAAQQAIGLAASHGSRAMAAALSVEAAALENFWPSNAALATEALAICPEDGGADTWDAAFWAAATVCGAQPWDDNAATTAATRTGFWRDWIISLAA